ncbi:MAG: S1C family serine protease [Candidatus Dormibacteraeota bacterium]|nr:S1C family serine protease [Candidatus Dormibacteraeota bacterium]
MLEADREPEAAGTPPNEPGAPHSPVAGRGLSRRLIAAVAALALLGGVAGVGGGWALGTALGPTGTAGTQTSSTSSLPASAGAAAGTGSSQSIDLQAIAARVDPAIVDINTVVKTAAGSGQAAGTGMILTSSGEVLTNNHVVEGATSINVTVAGRSGSYTATVIGVDPSADVALLQIQGVSGLPTVTLANSSTLKIGDPVVALGNALGAGGTPSETAGTVTALDQSITAGTGSGTPEQLTGMIQSDAQISAGDSGGALVNSAGQVVGMITAGATQGFNSSTTTVGFAVPSSAAHSLADQILAGQSSADIILGQVGYLGVSVSDQAANAASPAAGAGAVVVGLEAGSPAAQAGILQGAVITSVGGGAVNSVADLGTALHKTKPGQQVQVGWTDQGGSHSATVPLVAGPAV